TGKGAGPQPVEPFFALRVRDQEWNGVVLITVAVLEREGARPVLARADGYARTPDEPDEKHRRLSSPPLFQMVPVEVGGCSEGADEVRPVLLELGEQPGQ